jgi:hypothetical protein
VIWKLLVKFAPLTLLFVFTVAMTVLTYLILGAGDSDISSLFPWHP